MTPSGTLTEFHPDRQPRPRLITAGPDGNMWFTEGLYSVTQIGRINP